VTNRPGQEGQVNATLICAGMFDVTLLDLR
jgi:hypothetical protein